MIKVALYLRIMGFKPYHKLKADVMEVSIVALNHYFASTQLTSLSTLLPSEEKVIDLEGYSSTFGSVGTNKVLVHCRSQVNHTQSVNFLPFFFFSNVICFFAFTLAALVMCCGTYNIFFSVSLNKKYYLVLEQ